MERKRAWITAGVIAVTFITAGLAVMANTGLLSIDRPARQVGRLTPAAFTTPPPSSAAAPNAIVRYQDVYVTTPVDPTAATEEPSALTTPAPQAGGDASTKIRSTTRTKSRSRSHNEGDDEGNDDDD